MSIQALFILLDKSLKYKYQVLKQNEQSKLKRPIFNFIQCTMTIQRQNLKSIQKSFFYSPVCTHQ